MFELPFGNSRVIISEILIQNINSYMETELIILKGGLHSGRKSQLHCKRVENNVVYLVFYERPVCNFQFHWTCSGVFPYIRSVH